MNHLKGHTFFLIFAMLLITSCSNGDLMKTTPAYKDILNSVSEKDWAELSQKKIYFGHQSVGFNIIDGIKDLMSENKKINLNIKETDDLNDFSQPIFAHSRIGHNTNLSSKLDAFKHMIQQDLGDKVDIAFFKFCYVDITEKTDVKQIFETYKQTMYGLQKKFPETVFIHATVPLRTIQTSWKTQIKKILGKDLWEYTDNIKKNEFNEMIRHEYGDTGRLFDIAYAESTYPDRRKEGFNYNGKQYTSLIPSYTNDGGHLNKIGRKIVAAHLISLLAILS